MSKSHRFRQSLDKDPFAQEVIDSLRRTGEKGQLTYDRPSFSIHGDKGQMRLQNAYDMYCMARPDRRPLVIRDFTRLWFAGARPIPESFEDARHDVLPVVRQRARFEWISHQQPHFNLDDNHAVGLVFDFPEITTDIGHDQLAKWSITFKDAYAAAIGNLCAITSQPTNFRRNQTGFHCVEHDYASSYLLVPDIFSTLPFQGDPVVILPNQGVMLVTGADQPDSLAAMAEYAWQMSNMPRFWSGIPTRFANDRWTAYQPSTSHPACEALHKLKLRSLSRDYEWQKRALEEAHQKKGREIFVANFGVITDPCSGEPMSCCSWTEGVESLLPRTDLVMFGSKQFLASLEPEKGILVRWETASTVVGYLMAPVNTWPERHRVEQFPSDAELQELKRECLGSRFREVHAT